MPRLLVLTDRTQVPPGRTLDDVLAAAASAGLGTVVLRELDLPDGERARIAAAAVVAGLEVIAAHRAVAGCVGVHLPAAAVPVPGLPWGRSCHGRAEVVRAAAEGATWTTLSPYAPTASKPGHGPSLPEDAFTGLPVPTYALGGITPENAGPARASGAHGVAVMGAVMRATDPGAIVARLLTAVAA